MYYKLGGKKKSHFNISTNIKNKLKKPYKGDV